MGEYESSSIAAVGRSGAVGSLDKGTALGSRKPLVLVLAVRHVVFDTLCANALFLFFLLFSRIHMRVRFPFSRTNALFLLFFRISVRATSSLFQTHPIRLRRRRIDEPRQSLR